MSTRHMPTTTDPAGTARLILVMILVIVATAVACTVLALSDVGGHTMTPDEMTRLGGTYTP